MLARTFAAVTAWLIVSAAVAPAAELEADDLALVINRNVPESRELAEYYVQARSVPDGRIIELDLPNRDEISREQYEADVAAPVRQALMDRGLAGEVTCLVTVYGVPLKVGKLQAGEAGEAGKAELKRLDELSNELTARLKPTVDRAAATAEAMGQPLPQLPELAGPLQGQIDRLALSQQIIQQRAASLSDGEKVTLSQTTQSIAAELQARADPATEPLTPETANELRAAMATDGAEARRQALDLARRATLLDYAAVVAQQRRLLSEDQSDASLDSELATLPMANAAAALWLPNPLAGGRGTSGLEGDAMMVSRLDAPTPQQVRDLIAESVLAERDGLEGKIVIDSRGLAMPGAGGKPDGYAPFDEQLRQLATYLKTASRLEVVHDDRAETFERGDLGSAAVSDVALYVGWYRLRSYNAPFDFVPGSVAFHVASYEMVNLHNPGEKGWAAGLLRDGVASTLGPTSEPYLSAFPPPGRYVPEILSGEWTLAEAYWRSVPHVSWKMALVGDPLYRPFAARPALVR